MTRSPAEVMVELAPRIRFYLNEAAFGATFTEKGQAEMRELCDKIDAALAASPLSVETVTEDEAKRKLIDTAIKMNFCNNDDDFYSLSWGDIFDVAIAALRSSGIDGGE